jgi:acetylglutamate kinase
LLFLKHLCRCALLLFFVAKLNKRTVHEIGLAGGSAIGLSGKDDGLLRCTQMDVALGLVGEPVLVNTALLRNLLDLNLVPVVAPIGVGLEGDANTYNVNADVRRALGSGFR